MTKNLFFREYIALLKAGLSIDSFSIRIVIFFFLLSIYFFKATAVEVQPPVQEMQAVIYVAGNAQIYGVINNAVVIAKVKSQARVGDISKKEAKQQLNQIQIATVKKEENYKKLADKIESVKKRFFYTSTSKSTLTDFYRNQLTASATSVYAPTNLKCGGANISAFNFVIKYNTQLQTQKFLTSLSYLQFKKYCNSSLRGPPLFS